MSSGPRHSKADHARATDPERRQWAGMLRRYVVDRTTKAVWKLLGYTLPDVVETIEAEVFGSLGLAARPPDGVEAAVVVANVNGTEQPIIIAARDEQTIKAVAASIGADETMLHNSQAHVYLKNDGSIEAKSVGGAAVALATKADLDALADYIATQLTLPVSGATAGPIAAPVPPASTGTTKFKAE